MIREPVFYVMTGHTGYGKPMFFHAQVSSIREAFESVGTMNDDPWDYYLVWWNPWWEEWKSQKLGQVYVEGVNNGLR